ncbi:hypothetical protein BDV35DRAFT_341312 [Aspergillus flavus]|uniref:Uncharacterized protein n=1 Tax=Aspergillus flavus TaxID=5059 RepID=A0A5N6HAJ6_ASPFL|nr:hypothetical protein BDV35DRAFT_341312 [Aspergillus flavus]
MVKVDRLVDCADLFVLIIVESILYIGIGYCFTSRVGLWCGSRSYAFSGMNRKNKGKK